MLEQVSEVTRRDSRSNRYAMFRCSRCGDVRERRVVGRYRRQEYCQACAASWKREHRKPEDTFFARYISAMHGKALICQVVAALVGARGNNEMRWCAEFADGFVQGDRTVDEPYMGPLSCIWQMVDPYDQH